MPPNRSYACHILDFSWKVPMQKPRDRSQTGEWLLCARSLEIIRNHMNSASLSLGLVSFQASQGD